MQTQPCVFHSFSRRGLSPVSGRICFWYATIDFFTLPLVMIFNALFKTRGQILRLQSFWSVIPVQTLFSCMRKMNRQLTSQITLPTDAGTISLFFFFLFHYLGIGSEEKGNWFSQLVSAASVLQHCLPSKVHQWTEKIGLDFGAEGLFWKTKGFLSASFEHWSLRIRPQVRPQSSDRIQSPCSSHYISQTAG